VIASDLANVTLRSESGDVHAESLSGTTTLQASSGDITASGLTSSDVSANDDSGTVSIDFAAVPQRIAVQDSSGDVNVLLPPGDQAYNVTAHSDSGDTRIGVPTDPSSSNIISISVASGDVRIEPNV
jgi:DUF4097 and DUF4098 domain-containing protein YvlB